MRLSIDPDSSTSSSKFDKTVGGKEGQLALVIRG